ncbi:glycoside hydrolase family 25 protein [Oscillospiraceae bacterium PP1C4]
MTTVKQWNLQAAYFCMALLIAFSSVLNPQTISALSSLPFYGFSPPHRDVNLPVIIKTQKAADKIKNGIKGIDVSQFQGNIDWESVANDGIEFAMIRASAGTATDKKFKINAKSAHKNDILVGAYHYATFSSVDEAKEQARYFIKLLKSIKVTYPVVLDLEENKATRNISKAKLTAAGLAFMDTVKKAGYDVMLYSNENFFLSHIDTRAVRKKGYDLWVANYIEKPTKVEHKMWQHTSYGRVDGIDSRVDINIAYTDLSINKKNSVDETASSIET